jgi:hypothetical protein
MQELVAEIMECSAYYLVAYKGALDTPGAVKQAEYYDGAYRRALFLGYTIGKKLGISDEAAQARVLLHANEMTKLLTGPGGTGNWPVLMLKHKDRCAALLKDPLPRQVGLMKRECNRR